MKKLLSLLCVALLLPVQALATVWHANSVTGSDSNTCTQAQTSGTAKATITAALACVGSAGTNDGAGDTVQVAAGTYDEGLIDVIPSGSGSGAPFTLKCVTHLACNIFRGSGDGAGIGFSAAASHWIIIEDFEIEGVEDGADSSGGVYMSGSEADFHHHITWRNLKIGPAGMGVSGTGAGDITFENSIIHDCGSPTFFVGGLHCMYPSRFTEDWIIRGMVIGPSHGYGIHLWEEVEFGPEPIGFTITGNIVFGSGTIGNNGNGILVDGDNHVVTNNIIYGNVFEGIRVASAGFPTIVFNTLYGNCLVGCSGSNAGIRAEFTGAVCRNNLSIDNGDGVTDQIICNTESNNVLTGSAASHFVNAGAADFHLVTGSSAIDAGVAVMGITTDKAGAARADPPDVGAFEFDPDDPPPTINTRIRLRLR